MQEIEERHPGAEDRIENIDTTVREHVRSKRHGCRLHRAQAHEDSARFMLGVYQQCYHDQLNVIAALYEQINM